MKKCMITSGCEHKPLSLADALVCMEISLEVHVHVCVELVSVGFTVRLSAKLIIDTILSTEKRGLQG